MVSTFLFIEGTTNDTNDNLRKGFEALFERKLMGKMPRIIMGNGKRETIDKFKNRRLKQSKNLPVSRFLLVDLDKKADHRNSDISEHELQLFPDKCFFMIQEMESWFISQPEAVLNECFKVEVSKKIPKKKAIEFEEPDKRINEWLASFGKRYNKVRDATKMLKLLNLEQLMADFPDVKNLVEELQKA